LRLVPTLAAAAQAGQRSSHTEETRSPERFDLPERHPAYAENRSGSAFLTVMEGCDMFCSFCIVPTTRGREISRPADSIVAEAEALVESGVCEVTLLGQTVNAYGRHDLRRGNSDNGTIAFGALLRRLDAIPGLDRIRYTSPHPLFFDGELVAAHRELESLCPHVHLPLQSGSAAILERMRRRYSPEQYLEIVSGLRAARPDIAITTDLIVGTPGESQADFEATLALVRDVAFADSFCFKYSPRPGTAAAEATDPVDPQVASLRLEELLDLQRSLTLTYNRARVGSSTRILLEGPSRRGGGQLRGRDPYGKVVNVDPGAASSARPGQLLDVEIVEATPHSLVGIVAGAPQFARPIGDELRVL
jgi:tRNA-2-methylthio-N6-dimethylallyladenosine synthase